MMVEAMAIYDRSIRARLEPTHNGEFVVINLDTGEYEVGERDAEVTLRARARFPKARLFTHRVGSEAAYRIGFLPKRTA